MVGQHAGALLDLDTRTLPSVVCALHEKDEQCEGEVNKLKDRVAAAEADVRQLRTGLEDAAKELSRVVDLARKDMARELQAVALVASESAAKTQRLLEAGLQSAADDARDARKAAGKALSSAERHEAQLEAQGADLAGLEAARKSANAAFARLSGSVDTLRDDMHAADARLTGRVAASEKQVLLEVASRIEPVSGELKTVAEAVAANAARCKQSSGEAQALFKKSEAGLSDLSGELKTVAEAVAANAAQGKQSSGEAQAFFKKSETGPSELAGSVLAGSTSAAIKDAREETASRLADVNTRIETESKQLDGRVQALDSRASEASRCCERRAGDADARLAAAEHERQAIRMEATGKAADLERSLLASAAKVAGLEEGHRASAGKAADFERHLDGKLAEVDQNLRVCAAKVAGLEDSHRAAAGKAVDSEEKTGRKLAEIDQNLRASAAKVAGLEESHRVFAGRASDSEEKTGRKLAELEQGLRGSEARAAQLEQDLHAAEVARKEAQAAAARRAEEAEKRVQAVFSAQLAGEIQTMGSGVDRRLQAATEALAAAAQLCERTRADAAADAKGRCEAAVREAAAVSDRLASELAAVRASELGPCVERGYLLADDVSRLSALVDDLRANEKQTVSQVHASIESLRAVQADGCEKTSDLKNAVERHVGSVGAKVLALHRDVDAMYQFWTIGMEKGRTDHMSLSEKVSVLSHTPLYHALKDSWRPEEAHPRRGRGIAGQTAQQAFGVVDGVPQHSPGGRLPPREASANGREHPFAGAEGDLWNDAPSKGRNQPSYGQGKHPFARDDGLSYTDNQVVADHVSSYSRNQPAFVQGKHSFAGDGDSWHTNNPHLSYGQGRQYFAADDDSWHADNQVLADHDSSTIRNQPSHGQGKHSFAGAGNSWHADNQHVSPATRNQPSHGQGKHSFAGAGNSWHADNQHVSPAARNQPSHGQGKHAYAGDGQAGADNVSSPGCDAGFVGFDALPSGDYNEHGHSARGTERDRRSDPPSSGGPRRRESTGEKQRDPCARTGDAATGAPLNAGQSSAKKSRGARARASSPVPAAPGTASCKKAGMPTELVGRQQFLAEGSARAAAWQSTGSCRTAPPGGGQLAGQPPSGECSSALARGAAERQLCTAQASAAYGGADRSENGADSARFEDLAQQLGLGVVVARDRQGRK
eukprot:gene17239-26465_t